MGAVGTSLSITGEGNREKLFDAVHRHILECLRLYTDASVYDQLTPYLRHAAEDREDSWGPDESALHWMFPDFGGNCMRSKYLWLHWLYVAVSADWDAIAALVRREGFEVGERWSLSSKHGNVQFIELRDDVWMVGDDCLHGDGEHVDLDELTAQERRSVEAARELCACGPCEKLLRPQLAGGPPPSPRPSLDDDDENGDDDDGDDDDKPPAADRSPAVDPSLRAGYAHDPRDSHDNHDNDDYGPAPEPMLQPAVDPPPGRQDRHDSRDSDDNAPAQPMIQPAAPPAVEPTEWTHEPPGPELEEQVLFALRDRDRALRAARYLVTGTMASPRLLLALITSATFPSEVRPLIEKYASRVEGGVDALIAAWPTLDDKARGNALYAIAAMNRTTPQSEWLMERFRTALATEDDDAACAAAELAGRLAVNVPEFRLLVAAVLDRSFIREPMRLAAVLGLGQMRNLIGPIPAEIKQRLEREAERGGDGAGMASSVLSAWD